MNASERAEFGRILRRLFLTFEMAWNEEVAEVWWTLMQGLTLRQFADACQSYLMTGTNRPRPGHILAIAVPQKPDPDKLIAMAKAKKSPIAIAAYAFLRDWLDQPHYELRQRAMEFLETWDETCARVAVGNLSRRERHYCGVYGVTEPTPQLENKGE